MAKAPYEPWIPILFVVFLLLGIGLAIGFVAQSSRTAMQTPSPSFSPQNPPSASPDPASGVQFSGTLTADECVTSNLPVGDVGCSVTVDSKYQVQVAHGNAYTNQPWGQLIGFPAYPTSPVGSKVTVFAHRTDDTDFTLGGSSAFYVKITN